MKVAFPKIDGFPDINYGIAAVMASLRGTGHEAVLLDGTFIPASDRRETILKHLMHKKPDVVAFSVTIEDYFETLRYAREVKTLAPDMHVLLGGPFPTLTPHEMIAHPEVDSLCLGDGDRLSLFLEWLGRRVGGPPKGFVCKDSKGNLVGKFNAYLHQDLDALPFIDLADWDIGMYQKYWPMKKELPLISSRGCPHSCAFCSSGALRRAAKSTPRQFYRLRSPESLLDELAHNLDKFPGRFGSVFFKDSLFGWDREWFGRFTKLYTERGYHDSLPWSGAVRAESVTRDWAKRAREAGCAWVRLAPESADEHYRLMVYQKNILNKHFADATKNLREVGIPFYMCMIIGGPGETLHDVLHNILWMIKSDPFYFGTTTFRLIPGTDLYSQHKEHFGWRGESPRLVKGGLHPAAVDVLSRYLIPAVQHACRFRKALNSPSVLEGWAKYLLNIEGCRGVPLFRTSRDIHALALAHIQFKELRRGDR